MQISGDAESSPQSYFGGQHYLGSSSAGASSLSAAAPVDGKGRPINLLWEKTLIVRLDGGLYQEAESDPPAYQIQQSIHSNFPPPFIRFTYALLCSALPIHTVSVLRTLSMDTGMQPRAPP